MNENLTDKEKIRLAVRSMVKGMIPTPFAYGFVDSVDEEKMLAVIKDAVSELEYFDVVLSLGSIIPIPSVGSLALVGLTSKNGEASFMVWAEKIKKYTLVMDNGFKIELKDDGTMTMNGNNLDGLAVVGKIAEKMNNLEDAVNNHIIEYNLHVHPVTAINTPTGIIASPSTINLNKTDKSDLENKKIKHGN